MKPIHYGALLLLGAIWGASFLFIGIAVPAFGPLALMFLRVAIAGSVLALIALLTRQHFDLQLRSQWRHYLMIGLLNSAVPFTLIAFSELHLPVALAAILNSTTPLFTALIASVWGREVLTGRKLLGVLLGMAGVAVLVGGSPLNFDAGIGLALLASLLAACFYGMGTVYASNHISGLPPIAASMVQLLSAALILAVPTALNLPAVLPSATALWALLALALLATAFAYLLYFFLLRQVGPTRTTSVTFLVPVFGSLWSVLFLNETLGLFTIVGMAIIFASIGLVSRRAAPKAAALVVGDQPSASK